MTAGGDEDREELRLALVMTGGVSLAVWMGGVAQEINRLIRSDETYRALLNITNTSARVDVIAGASAGGLNGALLALAMARDVKLDPLRDLWLEHGSLTSLFRSPMKANAPSMMQGDDFFWPRLFEAFQQLNTKAGGRLTEPKARPINLTITTTLLKGNATGWPDDFGSVLPDVSYRGEFRFERDRQGDDPPDDFGLVDIADRLALAARSTASFPGAFEASFVPVGHREDPQASGSAPRRVDMSRNARWRRSRFVVDGGALVNKPIGPVLRDIFAQPASDRRVRRVLAFVAPDPGKTADDVDDDPAAVPTLGSVVLDSTVKLPRWESVGSSLQDLREHNRRADAQQRLRQQLLGPDAPVGLDKLAEGLFATYRRFRAANSVDDVLGRLDPMTDRSEALAIAKGGEALLDELLSAPEAWLPKRAPQESMWEEPWTWGVGAIEHAAVSVLDLVKRAMHLAGASGGGKDPTLVGAREQLHDILGKIGKLRAYERTFWDAVVMALAGVPGPSGTPLPRPHSFDSWLEIQGAPKDGASADVAALDRPASLALDVAGILLKAVPSLRAAAQASVGAGSTDGEGDRDRSTLTAMVDALVRDVESEAVAGDAGSEEAKKKEKDAKEVIATRLIGVAIVQYALSGGKPELEQPVELILISADTPNGLDARDRVRDKLAGIQLGHFGAFYKRSWRANDWMWGRLDGAYRLVQVVLGPARLRQRRLTAKEACLEIMKAALGKEKIGGSGSPVLATLKDSDLRDETGWRFPREDILQELAFLDKLPGKPVSPLPKGIPLSVKAVARRIQLNILGEELPGLALAIADDRDAGATVTDPAKKFLRELAAAQSSETAESTDATMKQLPLSTVPQVFESCHVGTERIREDMGSDLFTRTTSTAFGVAVSAAGGTSGGMGPARAVFHSLRGFALLLWVMARSAVSKHRSGFALMMLLLAAGGAVLAVGLVEPKAVARPLTTLATALIAAGILLALIRAGALGLLFYIAATVALAIGPYIYVTQYLNRQTGWGSWLHRAAPAIPVIALVGGSMLLGLVRRGTVNTWAARIAVVAAAVGIGWAAWYGYRKDNIALTAAALAGAAIGGAAVAWILRGAMARRAGTKAKATPLVAPPSAASTLPPDDVVEVPELTEERPK
jgi:patatin-related protein